MLRPSESSSGELVRQTVSVARPAEHRQPVPHEPPSQSTSAQLAIPSLSSSLEPGPMRVQAVSWGTPATHWQALVAIRVPLALPGLISGLRVAAPLAPLGAVVGEWVGASAGLGFVMVQANARMQTATVFAAMAILAALTVLLRLAVDRLTAGLTPWAEETETPSFLFLRRRHPTS